MKTFTNVQQVWAHCMFCPVCQDMTRRVEVFSGPEGVVQLSHARKEDQILHLTHVAQLGKQKYRTTYHIDCVRNTFTLSVSDLEPAETSVDKAKSPYFSFYVTGVCNECDFTFAESSVMELDILRKSITDIGIVHEEVTLGQRNKYNISLHYDDNQMIINKLEENASGELVEGDKNFTYPLINLDFSKPDKVINKIKTLLVFS